MFHVSMDTKIQTVLAVKKKKIYCVRKSGIYEKK